MNQDRLTTVTRSLSNRPSHRHVLRGLAAAIGGLGLTSLLNGGETAAASC